METSAPLLRAENIKKYFPIKSRLGEVKSQIKAIDDVSLRLYPRETYGLVGETGCGKSTFGRSILKLLEPTGGEIFFDELNITRLNEKEMRPLRARMQMVFQDPYTSLNPRKRVGAVLTEALSIHHRGDCREREEWSMNILQKVGLQPRHFHYYPHELSGGQRQRVGLARALILNPGLVVCDEPVSALDMSVQSQIINLLLDLQEESGVTYLFISHNMSVVRFISSRIGVMYLGRLVEESRTDELFSAPAHPYTKALISAIPTPIPKRDKKRIVLEGEIPSPMDIPSGCVFHTRCPLCTATCRDAIPPPRMVSKGHWAACHNT